MTTTRPRLQLRKTQKCRLAIIQTSLVVIYTHPEKNPRMADIKTGRETKTRGGGGKPVTMSTGTLSSKIHHSLDYRARLQSDPRYDLSDVYPQTGQRHLNVSSQNTNIVEFELPPRCINLARSKLEFDIQIELEAKMALAAQDDTVHARTDCLSLIDRVEVFTRSGVRLMDLERQQLWSKLSNTYFASPDMYTKKNVQDAKRASDGGKSFAPQYRWQKPWLQVDDSVTHSVDIYNFATHAEGKQLGPSSSVGLITAERKTTTNSTPQYRSSW